MTNTNLTEEQKKFLEECENEFKDRYTEKDSDFMKVKNAEIKKPPIIDPWHPKQRRSCDWQKQNQECSRSCDLKALCKLIF
ncbi:hypothetical protein KM043_018101 [Ampulex compressa]|nr:hypothetical protein KM043_018101 [Ampulex compressa]